MSNMRLFELTVENGMEYGDYESKSKLIVANSQNEADIRARNWMQDEYDSGSYPNAEYYAKEHSEVDGFLIRPTRKGEGK